MKRRHPITGCRVDTLLNDLWLVSSPQILQGWVDQALSLDLNKLVEMRGGKSDEDKEEEDDAGYKVEDGVAVMHVRGAITKYPTSFGPVMGGTSCIGMRNALDHAAKNDAVKAIIIRGESHGGTADGLDSLNKRIAKIDTQTKPIFGFADDVSCSAMYWILSGTREIGANANAVIGSIGGMMIVRDFSEAFKKEGIKVIPIATGSMKAVGAPGVELKPEEVEYISNMVKQRTQPFFDAVAKGRRLTTDQIGPIIQTASIYTGRQGKELGLVDHVEELDEFTDRVRSQTVNTRLVDIPPRSNDMNLSAEQLATIRTVCGNQQLSEAGALDSLLQRAVSMNTQLGEQTTQINQLKAQLPKTVDQDVLNGRAELKAERLDLLKTQGKITQAQTDHLTKMLNDNKQVMVGTTLASGKSVIDGIVDSLTLGVDSGIANGRKAEGQAQPFVPNSPSGDGKPGDEMVEGVLKNHFEAKAHDYGANLTQAGSIAGKR
jgi:signal peptide peptidase SppA